MKFVCRGCAVETLGRQDAELGLRQVEPAAVLGLAAPNLAELDVALSAPGAREGAAMTETTLGPLNNVITVDDERIKNHLDRIVRGSEEESLNALLEDEADRLCNAQRYERSEARRDTRAGPS
jgi:mutator family transposase